MDRLNINDHDKRLIFRKTLEFIWEVRAGISWEHFCNRAVLLSSALIEMLNQTEDSREFLSSMNIEKGYVAENIRNILYRLHLNEENNLYLILALPPHATQDEINKRWKDLMRIYHPDRHIISGDTADECAKRINHAHSVLKDLSKRQEYGRKIRNYDKFNQKMPLKSPHKTTVKQRGLFISPKLRNMLPRFITIFYISVAIVALTIIYIENKLDKNYINETYKINKQSSDVKARSSGSDKEGLIPLNQKTEGQENTLASKPAPVTGNDKIADSQKRLPKQEGRSREEAKEANKNASISYNRIDINNVAVSEPLQAKKPLMEKIQTYNISERAKPSQTDRQQEVFNAPDGMQMRDEPPKSIAEGMGMMKPSNEVDKPNIMRTVELKQKDADNQQNEPAVSLDENARFFIKQYISAYEKGDIERLISFYSLNAKENKMNYDDIKRAYLKYLDGRKYQYTIKDMHILKRGANVIVTGKYDILRLDDKDPRFPIKGNIVWTLAIEKESFKIIKIAYDSN